MSESNSKRARTNMSSADNPHDILRLEYDLHFTEKKTQKQMTKDRQFKIQLLIFIPWGFKYYFRIKLKNWKIFKVNFVFSKVQTLF